MKSLANMPRLPHKTRRPRLLVVGDAVAATGFARVTRCILERLQDRYDIHQLGVNYFGDPHNHSWKIYPASLKSDVHGVNRLRQLVSTIQPELVFAVSDLWILSRHAQVLAPYADKLKTVLYFPVDGGPIVPSLLGQLRQVDRLVTYTQYGRSEMDRATAIAQKRDPALLLPPLSVMPHGIDNTTFAPLDPSSVSASRRQARRILFQDRPELQDAFIVLNANRNQPRKRIDITLEAFAAFAQGKPDNVKLFLHMGYQDVGWNIHVMAERLNLVDRLIMSSHAPSIPGLPLEQLNLIYNACDVGLNTSVAEGWGLVSFEHAATGAAQVVPRHSACAELWEGAAELVDPAFTLTEPGTLLRGQYVTPQAVAAALNRIYRDNAYHQHLRDAAYANALQPRYSWDNIAEQWHELFQELLSERYASMSDAAQ